MLMEAHTLRRRIATSAVSRAGAANDELLLLWNRLSLRLRLCWKWSALFRLQRQRRKVIATVTFFLTFTSVYLWRKGRRRFALKSRLDIEDPTFGPGILHKMDDPDRLHEAFLDHLHLERHSPIRGHLLQLFRRPDLDEQFGRLFDEASGGAPRLSREAFTRISQGIYGHLHQLLKGKERMPLAPCTPEDQRWIFRHFDQFFPPERPLDRRMFTGYFKLILMRRIVRTLVASIGLQKLRRGTSAPLVLIVGVDLGGGHPPFRINTVTPNAKTVLCGESLALIEEVSQEAELSQMPDGQDVGLLPALLNSLRRFVK